MQLPGKEAMGFQYRKDQTTSLWTRHFAQRVNGSHLPAGSETFPEQPSKVKQQQQPFGLALFSMATHFLSCLGDPSITGPLIW